MQNMNLINKNTGSKVSFQSDKDVLEVVKELLFIDSTEIKDDLYTLVSKTGITYVGVLTDA